MNHDNTDREPHRTTVGEGFIPSREIESRRRMMKNRNNLMLIGLAVVLAGGTLACSQGPAETASTGRARPSAQPRRP